MSRGSNRIWQTVRSWWRGASEVRRALREGREHSTLAACVEPLERRELPAASTSAFQVPANPDVLRSQGPQSTLVVRVDLEDRDLKGLLGDLSSITTLTDARIRDAYAEVNEFYTRQSFGKLTFPDDQLTIVPGRMSLPFSVRELEKSSAGPAQILKSVEKKLRDKGYKLDDYLHITIIHPYLEGKSFEYAGLGYLAGDRLWLNANIIPEVWAHELGHNAGAPHIGVFDPKDPQAIVGDPKQMTFLKDESTGLDLMESGSELVGIDDNGDMFALRKTQFGWLDIGTNVVNVTQSGQYRLFATDSGTEQDDRVYALRIRRNSTQEYWLEYRESRDDGVTVTLHNYGGDKKLGLLDMTPESGLDEASLDIGRTFDDFATKIHITPLAMTSVDGANSIDVLVTIGDDLNNHPPTGAITFASSATVVEQPVQFTASVHDQDGDHLNYSWDFGDGYTAENTLNPTHRFQNAGDYFVRLTINDGRGGISEYVRIVPVAKTDPPIEVTQLKELDHTPTRLSLGEQRDGFVASDGQLRSVMIWTKSDFERNQILVMAQRFAGGRPIDSEFVVGDSLSGTMRDSFRPTVAMSQTGEFVVTWIGNHPVEDSDAIFVRRFSALGEAEGEAMLVSAGSRGTLHSPNIAIAPDSSRFAIAWSRDLPSPDGGFSLHTRVFDAHGNALNDPQDIVHASGNCAAIAMNSIGEFIVAWGEVRASNTNLIRVVAQRFHADGTRIGSPFAVSDYHPAKIDSKVAAAFAPDGGFSVVYGLRDLSAFGSVQTWMATVNPNGTIQSPDVVIPDRACEPALVIDANGNRIVSWVSGTTWRVLRTELRVMIVSSDGVVLSNISSTQRESPLPNGYYGSVKSSVAVLNSLSTIVVASDDYEGVPGPEPFIRFFEMTGPVVTEVDSVSTSMNQGVSVFVAGNDTNSIPGPLKLSLPVAYRYGNQSISAPRYGSVSINQNRTPNDPSDDLLVYTPQPGVRGTEEIVYQVTNSVGSTAYGVLRVHIGVPDPSDSGASSANPAFANDDRFVLKEDVTLKVGGKGVLKNEALVNRGPLTAELVTGPSHGRLTLNANGSFVYQPAPNFSGTDSFTYRVSNGQTVSRPTTVTLLVQPVVDKPKLTVPKTLEGLVGVPVSLPIVFGTADTDGSERLALKFSGLPATAMLNRGVRLADGTWRLRADDLPGLTMTVFGPGSLNLKVDCSVGEALGSALTKASASLRITVSGTAAA